MKILIGCEESQRVVKQFRMRGHTAFSCDLLPCSGGYPEWHIQHNVLEVINEGWDAMICFPPCTFLSIAGNGWNKDQPKRKSGALVGEERMRARIEAIKFFIDLYYSPVPKISLENPVGIMSTILRQPDQIIHPWMFGNGESKPTCLWLKGFPKLTWEPMDNLFYQKTAADKKEKLIVNLPRTPDRAMIRSKTFPGIAAAMAEQWG